MKDGIYCLLGFTLLFSSLSMVFIRKDNDIFKNLNQLLNEEQKKIYQKIIYERMSIYIIGSILGIISGISYLFKYKKDNYRICKFLAIVYVIKLGFYKIYPKSPLLLYSLTTKEQTDAWADIYTEMKYRWIKSLGIGFIGYALLSCYICKKCK